MARSNHYSKMAKTKLNKKLFATNEHIGFTALGYHYHEGLGFYGNFKFKISEYLIEEGKRDQVFGYDKDQKFRAFYANQVQVIVPKKRKKKKKKKK